MNRGFHILLIDLDGSAIATLAFQKFIEPHQQHIQPTSRTSISSINRLHIVQTKN